MKNKFNLLHILFIGILNTILVLIWYFFYEEINHFIWENEFVSQNRYMIPLIVIFFSLIVGLCIKYLKAPTCVNGSSMAAIKGGGEEPNWRRWPGMLLTSWSSLFSGAIVGPEGSIGELSLYFATWFNEKFIIPAKDKQKAIMAAFASGYNGLLQSPVFTAVLASDLEEDKKSNFSNLPSNLIAGVIGYVIFLSVTNKSLANFLHLEQLNTINVSYILHAVLFSAIGIIFAILTGTFFKLSVKIFGPLKDKVIYRALLAGCIIGMFGYFYPLLLFSGEKGSLELVAEPLKYGVMALFALALLKTLLLGVSLKSGFLGGPVFPLIFASTAASLAVSSFFPAIPLVIILASILTGWMTILFKAPFMILLLVGMFVGANTYIISIIAIALSVALLFIPILNKLKNSNSAA